MSDDVLKHIVWGSRQGIGERARARIRAAMADMTPGQQLRVDKATFEQAFPPMAYKGARWTSEDRFLENSVGSAYGCWRVTQSLEDGSYLIIRGEEGPDRVWTSPDRR